VRSFLPKGANLLEVTDTDVQAVQDRLNGRPRKVLGYRTPGEVLRKAQSP